MSTRRTSWALASAGLVAGLALGVTGFARAADPTPSPAPSAEPQHQPGDRGPGGHRGPFGPLRGEHRPGYGGLVTAIDSDSLTLRTPRGSETVGLTSSTTYYVGRSKATRSAIEKGAVVHVRLADPRATTKVAAVVEVVPAHVVGWVTRVGDDTLTVTDPSGFTRTIRTSSGTTYVKDGATTTRSAISVGTFVRAVGRVADDGTTLDATRVATGRPDPQDRPGARRPGVGPAMDAPGADGAGWDAPMDAPVA